MIGFCTAKVIWKDDKDFCGSFFVEMPNVVSVTRWYEEGHWLIKLKQSNGHCETFLKDNIIDERNGDDMSSDLYWKPRESLGEPLCTNVKDAIRRHYGEEVLHGIELDKGHLPFLRGLLAAGILDAKTLIDEIGRHKVIIVTERNL